MRVVCYTEDDTVDMVVELGYEMSAYEFFMQHWRMLCKVPEMALDCMNEAARLERMEIAT